MLLPIEVLELCRFAAKPDEGRWNLEWIQIERTLSGLRASATEGHMLGTVTLCPDPTMGIPALEKPIYLKATSVMAALKTAPKRVRLEGAVLSVEEATLRLGLTSTSIEVTDAPDFTFPDVDQVIPKEKDRTSKGPVGLDMKFVDAVSAWAKACGRKTVFGWELGGEFEPAVLHAPRVDGLDIHAKFLIMPARL